MAAVDLFTVLVPIAALAAVLFAYFMGNKKARARTLKKAIIRVLDDSGEELIEDLVDYAPGKGLVTYGKMAFPVTDSAIIRSRGVSIITVNASNGKALNLKDLAKNDEPLNSYQLQALLISLFASAKAGVVELVEAIKQNVMLILVGVGIVLLLSILNFVHSGEVSQDLAMLKSNVTAIYSLVNQSRGVV
jgi:hypothetical protein